MTYPFVCQNDSCSEVGKVKEITMKMSEYTPDHICPACGYKLVRTVESLISGASINKCGGFYRNVN